MSRKKKKENKETTIENYYDLKVDKVDELVEALKSGSSGSSMEGGEGDSTANAAQAEPLSTSIADCTGEATPDTRTKKGKEKHFDPYKIDKFSRIPVWIKALFIKFWFAGVVCYFVVFGLSLYIAGDDTFLVCGLILGLLTDFIVNPVYRMLESDDKEYNWYMMFPFPLKAFWTIFTNIIYYIVVMYAVSYMYVGLNELINLIRGTEGYFMSLGVEPLLCGVFAVIADMAFIGLKDLVVWLVKRSKKKKALAAEGISATADTALGGDLQNGATDAEASPEADNAEGETDEVERLRKLAESQNAAEADDGGKKHKKK